MTTVSTEVWQFVVEWYDPMPQLKKQFMLKYFLENHQVEMIDLKSKKIYLKKTACPPEIASSDLFIGSKILLYSRELEIVDYGDTYTRNKLQTQLQPSIALFTANSAQYWGRYLDKISSSLQVISLRTVYISDPMAEEICSLLNVSQRKRADLVAGVCLVVLCHGQDGLRALETKCVITFQSRSLLSILFISITDVQSFRGT